MGRREELPAEVLLGRRAISVGRARGKAGTGEGRTRGGATHAEDAKHRKEMRPAAAQPNLGAESLAGGIQENSLPKLEGCLS